jgi:ABC-type molybdenum transport system ATPase subunit/photorepair protein PhrA
MTAVDHVDFEFRKGELVSIVGESGSGKTTLFALITGDSPVAYAADITVFGLARETGTELARIRRRIGVASPELQAYLGHGPEELLDAALRPKHDLLLLDEPFMNLDAHEARRLARRIEAYLRANREATAILICHRQDETPRGFDRTFDLDASAMR